jgi:hypothetical protein
MSRRSVRARRLPKRRSRSPDQQPPPAAAKSLRECRSGSTSAGGSHAIRLIGSADKFATTDTAAAEGVEAATRRVPNHRRNGRGRQMGQLSICSLDVPLWNMLTHRLRSVGEVPERSNGAVSKTVVPLARDRGFESLPLRQQVWLSSEFRALWAKRPGFGQEYAVDGTRERDLVVASGLFSALFL